MEVVGSYTDMLDEGLRLSQKFGEVCTVKVPCTPDSLLACKKLSIWVSKSMYLIFSAAQLFLLPRQVLHTYRLSLVVVMIILSRE